MDNFRTEQETLATLMTTSREPLNTSEMMWDNLKATLGDAKPEFINKVNEEIVNSGVKVLKDVPTQSGPRRVNLPEGVSSEKILEYLFIIYDNLINVFERTGIHSETSKDLEAIIHAIEYCVQYVGGKIEPFDPMLHVSGLEIPPLFKNAQRVIDTTKQCYKLGTVLDTNISDNGEEIDIILSGQNKSIVYKVSGKVSSSTWNGNEAIDYVYNSNGGKMSIKSFEGGKWKDITNTGNYSIKWELEEAEISNSDITEEKSSGVEKNITEENIESTKEDLENNKNNGDIIENLVENKDEEIQDFPVVEENIKNEESDNIIRSAEK